MISKNLKILSILFIISWVSLILYTVFDRSNYVYFWIIVIFNVIIILVQINYFKFKLESQIIYLELLLLSTAITLIYIMNLGSGSPLDYYYDLANIYTIYNSAWSPNVTVLGSSADNYPFSHFLALILAQITNCDVSTFLNENFLNMIRLISLPINLIIVSLYILIGKSLFKNEKITLMSTLGFIFLYVFSSLIFSRQEISTLLFFFIIFLIIAEKPKNPLIAILIVLSTIGLMFSHPLAPMVLFIFLTYYYIFVMFIDKFRYNSFNLKLFTVNFEKIGSSYENIRNKVSPNLIILLLTFILAYFIYIGIWEQKQFNYTLLILKGTLPTSPLGSGLATPIHWRIFLYGQALMGLIFGFLVLKSRKTMENFYALFFLSFGVLLTAVSVVFYYFNIEFVRFTIFSWPFILYAAAHAITHSNHSKILSVLMILFVICNMFGYFPSVYDKNQQIPGEWQQSVTEQQKMAVLTIQPNGRVLSNHYFNMILLFRNVNYVGDPELYFNGYKDPKKFKQKVDFFFVSKEDFENIFIRGAEMRTLTNETYNNYQNNSIMNRIYNNGDAYVYSIQ